jgi:dihydropteroate synthase
MRAEQRARRDGFLKKIGRHPIVIGILNLTPDSFSDGGRYMTAETALSQAKKMAAQGCDIIDVGGESTRPGASPISENEELARIEPIFAELASQLEVPLSIDTYRSKIAARAVELGSILINDVWGLQRDPAMAETIAAAEAAVVIMHNRTEKDAAIDIMDDIKKFLSHSLELAEAVGIPRSRIIVDPGVAFGKTARQNLEVLRRLGELTEFGCPILIGTSRKAFLGSLSEGKIEAQLIGTIATTLAAYAAGASLFRVHDVGEQVAALKVFHTIRSTPFQ